MLLQSDVKKALTAWAEDLHKTAYYLKSIVSVLKDVNELDGRGMTYHAEIDGVPEYLIAKLLAEAPGLVHISEQLGLEDSEVE